VWVAASGFASVIAVVIFWAGVQASVAVDFLGGSRWHGLPFLGWNYHGSMGAKSYLAIHSSALYVFFSWIC